MNINFAKYRNIYFVFSLILILASTSFIFIYGLNPGIDFTGGSILEVEYKTERPSNQEIRQEIFDLSLGEVSIQPTGEKEVILKMKTIDEDTHQKIIQSLGNDISEKSFESIGPSIGLELKQKTTTVVFMSVFAMVLYIAFAFRRVSRPIRSWQYGIITLFVIFHDVLIPFGIFSILGKFYDVQITIPVIVAFLTIIGYAINNVVVVFDRIRENLLRRTSASFEEIVNISISQTLSRQLSTSLTTLFPLLFIFFLGGETLKYFSLALILGLITGLYSSIFLASPLSVGWLRFSQRNIDKGR